MRELRDGLMTPEACRYALRVLESAAHFVPAHSSWHDSHRQLLESLSVEMTTWSDTGLAGEVE